MSTPIIDFYKGILTSLSLVVEDNGNVYLDLGDGYKEPTTVNMGKGQQKRLVLPVDSVLRDPNWESTVAFHPLSENIARKDSVVFKSLQSLINYSLNADIGHLISLMLNYCADSDAQANLNHRQNEFLQRHPNADAKSVKDFDKIESSINMKQDMQYVKVYTLRDKKLNNDAYPRVTLVKFPFYNEICEQLESGVKNPSVFGVKLRKKDLEGFKGLFEFIFKGVDLKQDPFSVGSRSSIAPSFHSLMLAYYKVKQELVKRFKLLKIETPDLTWGEALDNLTQFNGRIPPLAGNEGEITEGERRRNETAIVPEPAKQTTMNTLEPPKVAPVAPLQPVQPLQPVAPAVPAVQQPVTPAPTTANTTMKTLDPPKLNAQPQYNMVPANMPVNQYGQPVQMMYAMPPQQQMMAVGPQGYPMYTPVQPMVDRNGRPVSNLGYQTATPVQPNAYIQPTMGTMYQPQQQVYNQPPAYYQPQMYRTY